MPLPSQVKKQAQPPQINRTDAGLFRLAQKWAELHAKPNDESDDADDYYDNR